RSQTAFTYLRHPLKRSMLSNTLRSSIERRGMRSSSIVIRGLSAVIAAGVLTAALVAASPQEKVVSGIAVRSNGGSSELTSSPKFSPDEIKRWLSYLASDELQGRQVFTEGLGLAAAYIADHLKTWGVRPVGDEGTYYQTVKVHGMKTRSRSTVAVT